jgi:pimeloyl-ACP methyl ester carboxylesterase
MWRNLAIGTLIAAVLLTAINDPDTQGTDIEFQLNPAMLDNQYHPGFTRENEYFLCQNVMCHAWLYRPKIPNNVTIVMGCGIGAQKDFGMEKYARKFADHGFTVFLFDYRGFGASEGFPRNLIDPFEHLKDWRDAIDHVRWNISERITSSKLALWGTSFAGGHVLSIASQMSLSEDFSVYCVVSQMPFLDGKASALKNIQERGLVLTLRLLFASIQDILKNWIGKGSTQISIIGKKGSIAYMNVHDEDLQLYFNKLPKEPIGGWKNQAPARGLMKIRSYSPLQLIEQAKERLNSSVLLIGAAKDELCPLDWINNAKDKMGNVVEYHYEDCTHFEMYFGIYFESAVEKTLEFLQKCANA